jgi:dTDP-glucose pyrophosphorylase
MSEHMLPFLIAKSASVKQAMKRLEETEKKVVFVIESDSRLFGSLTDGDIRRWILNEGSLDDSIEKVCNTTPHFVSEGYRLDQVQKDMLEHNIGCVPVLNHNRQITNLLFWERVFQDESIAPPIRQIDIPVVVMAGGKGTRLDPFTRILPKPLIPIGDKTVIEVIIDSFHNCGVSDFYISVNHKSKIIKSYFEELNPPYKIQYIHEAKPLGTAGCLKYLYGRIHGSFIVVNCDVIIKTDYAEVLSFHYERDNDITLVASFKNYHIPYGICEIKNGGTLIKITEKPEYNFLVNTGMYVIKADILKHIPQDVFFHITNLIEKAKESGAKIGVFPIGDKAWIDTGEWAEYKKALAQLSF